MLAPAAKKVVGVEIVEEAVEAAKENAALNGLENCEFLARRCLKSIGRYYRKTGFYRIGPSARWHPSKGIGEDYPLWRRRMIYISCKPTSLARDLEVLTARGYQVERMCCVDMFPWSGNIETICLLSKKP